MSISYVPASQSDSSFGNPRQKTYVVLRKTDYGWIMDSTKTSIPEVQKIIKGYLAEGTSSIVKLAVAELIPIDFIITPQV